MATIEHECDRCLQPINPGEFYELKLVKNPPEFKSHGDGHTICHFHAYACCVWNDGPNDMFTLQQQDLVNIKRQGVSNNNYIL